VRTVAEDVAEMVARGRGRRRKSAAREGPAVAVVVLPLVRIWVCREAALTALGGGERRLWGSSGAEEIVEREGREERWLEKKTEESADFWTQIFPPPGHEIHLYL
jgi:hypothetical protein